MRRGNGLRRGGRGGYGGGGTAAVSRRYGCGGGSGCSCGCHLAAADIPRCHLPHGPWPERSTNAAAASPAFSPGDLAVSRALGDFVYKRCETVRDAEQAVTAFPDVIIEGRTAQDEFIVLACDGIWDVMSSQEVCDKVRERRLSRGRTASC